MNSQKTSKLLLKFALPLGVIIAVASAVLFLQKPSTRHAHEGSATVPIEVGSVLPDFELHPIDGDPIRVSSLQKDILIINFWASWCDACLVEMPSLVRLRDGLRDQSVEVIGINVDEEPAKVIPRLSSRLKLTFPSYADVDQKLSALFDVHAIPLTVIIDRNRKILHVEAGERDWNSKDIREKIDRWLAAQ